ncbi:MAG TPA: sulfite exporter TauE/SafE family protein [Pedococcus sp.]|nr:sulfite exporter TauE/SafE family protein [Pedococcus sp.]
MTAAVVLLAVLVGLSLGLLGGGGSILTVPLLVYVAGLQTREAIATSLLVVGVTSSVAAISHARAGRVQWRTGLWFGAAGMVGAYAGGRLGEHLPDGLLLTAFAAMMTATAVAMIRGRRAPQKPTDTPLPVGRVLLHGGAVGLTTGIIGAGGGFLIVPALTLLGGLSMPVAVGTSLLVIAMNSAAGLGGHLPSVDLDWGLAAMVTAAGVGGSLVGGRLAGRISPDRLRRAFGWAVLAMAAVVFVEELPDSLWVPLHLIGKVGVAAGAGLVLLGLGMVGQRLGRPAPAHGSPGPDGR